MYRIDSAVSNEEGVRKTMLLAKFKVATAVQFMMTILGSGIAVSVLT